MLSEDKMFKSPEEKKLEETLVEEKPAGGIEEIKKKQELEKLEDKAKVSEAKHETKPEVKPEAKPEAKPKEKEKKEEEGKPKRNIVLQRVYVIPLAKAYAKPRSLRGNVASRMLREFLAKHFKTEKENVKVDLKVANAIRARGSRKPLKKISVKASKDNEGIVFAELHV